jgi:hypothetical protein
MGEIYFAGGRIGVRTEEMILIYGTRQIAQSILNSRSAGINEYIIVIDKN